MGNFLTPSRGYGDEAYWSERYGNAQSVQHDWYTELTNELKTVFLTVFPRRANILDVGCGNSSMASQLYDLGYNITSIDFCSTAIAIAQCNIPHFRGQVMDARCMTFPDKSFDGIYDKGTMDGILDKNSTRDIMHGRQVAAEVTRVLKNGCKYISIGITPPEKFKVILVKDTELLYSTKYSKKIVITSSGVNLYIHVCVKSENT